MSFVTLLKLIQIPSKAESNFIDFFFFFFYGTLCLLITDYRLLEKVYRYKDANILLKYLSVNFLALSQTLSAEKDRSQKQQVCLFYFTIRTPYHINTLL